MGKKAKNQAKHLSHRVQEIITKVESASAEAKKDLIEYKEYLESLRETASKRTHYDQLNEWSDKAYGFVHRMLEKYGFVNGQPEVNRHNKDASLWWEVYQLISNIIYSPNLVTEVSNHHSSAYERNEAMILDLQDVIVKFEK